MEGGRRDTEDRDLLVVSLSGVQRFISESRTTSDLSSASEIMARLAMEATALCRNAGPETQIVFPVEPGTRTGGDLGVGGAPDLRGDGARGGAAVPNRVVALVPAGSGAAVGGEAARAVDRIWKGWVQDALGRVVDTPGMPGVQWVCAPVSLGNYATRWRLAQAALTARRRVRDFHAVEWTQRRLCSLSPRWPAEDILPPDLQEHERDTLSAANWVKRLWRPRLSGPGRRPGFPSTSSIASATFRGQVLDHLEVPGVRAAVVSLRTAVESLPRNLREAPVAGLDGASGLAEWLAAVAGPWVYADAWHDKVLKREYGPHDRDGRDLRTVAAEGRSAARRLAGVMKKCVGIGPPTRYLALLAQDLDGMGRFLSGEAVDGAGISVTEDQHTDVSRRLGALAANQWVALESRELLGVPVYAGGDDLLAFVPAATALEAARRCHGLAPAELPTASTAVLFFHSRSSLRRAVAEVRRLLEDAKAASPAKHALAVGFLRRSGVREQSIQPWQPLDEGAVESAGQTAAESFDLFTGRVDRRSLSPRLVTELERDADELAGGGLPEPLYLAELARLVGRHGGSRGDAVALARLGLHERSPAGPEAGGWMRRPPIAAARVAVFIRQECR